MSLKTILSAVLGESGFLVPDNFFNSTSPDDVQMTYLANRAARYIREKKFQRLVSTSTITLTTATEYDLPSDFLELVPDTTMTNGRLDAVIVPTTPETWAYLRARAGPSGYFVHARIIANKLSVYAPRAGDVLSFEYISNAPIMAEDGVTRKTAFTVDTDEWLLDEDLLILEIRWRFLNAKGDPSWQTVLEEAKSQRSAVLARDSSGRTIGGEGPDLFPEPYTPLWVS